MFGSEIAAAFVRTQLLALPAVTAAIGTRLANLMVLPADMALPGLIHYAEQGTYGAAMGGGGIASERLRYVVRLICQGESTEPIKVAAESQLTALDGATGMQGGAFVAVSATGEWPLTTTLEDGVYYRQLGTLYDIDITTGG